jgi:hypothetical protein
MNTLRSQLIAAGEIPEMRKMTDLTVPELDASISSLEPRLDSEHMGSRNAAQLALLALYKQRNRLAPPQLPAVPVGIEARSLNSDAVLPLTEPIGSVVANAELLLELASTQAHQPVAVA